MAAPLVEQTELGPSARENSYTHPPEDEYLKPQDVGTNGFEKSKVDDVYLTPTIAEDFPRKLPETPSNEKAPDIYDRIDNLAPIEKKTENVSKRKKWCIWGIVLAVCIITIVIVILVWYLVILKGQSTLDPSEHFSGGREAFSAYSPSISGYAESRTHVLFTKTWTKYGAAFSNSTFTNPSADLYFFSLAALNNGEGGLNFSLVGTPYSVGLSRTSTSHSNFDSFSRNILMSIQAGAKLSVDWAGYLACCFSTSWSLFSLSGAINPIVAISVTTSQGSSATGSVTFEEQLVNLGEWEIQDSHLFIVPVTGIYLFAISVGLPTGQGATLNLMKNNQKVLGILRSSSDHDGTDIISSSTMISLKSGDKMHLELLQGALYSSEDFRETSLTAFLYQTEQSSNAAWSVRRSTSFVGNLTRGVLEPVHFDVVLVNEDGIFSRTDNWVIIKRAGIYFVEVTVGVLPGIKARVFVSYGTSLDRRLQTATIGRESNTTTGYDTVTAGAVISLDVGHKVWVSADAVTGWGFYSNQDLVAGFTGFMIY